MQKVTEKPSSRRRGRPPATSGEHDPAPQEVRDRLAELLPEEALQDALQGLAPEDITGAGGLMAQLAQRVDPQDRQYRSWAGRGEHAASSEGQLRAAARR